MTTTTCTPSMLGDLDIELKFNEPIGSRTWYRAGGSAEVLAHPRSVEALCQLIKRCHENDTPVRVLGEGANLLVADDGVDGVVIRLDHAAFRGANFEGGHCNRTVRVGAGTDLMGLVQESARNGYDGLSHLAGIPASIGGATRMNAGGAFGDFASAVHSVDVVAPDGKARSIAAADLEFAYRHSNLAEVIVVAANINFIAGDRDAIRQRVKEVFAYKKRSQPMADKSAGCMFKNPTDPATGERVSAGKLIDQAGMKGKRIGSASVSLIHGNFLSLAAGGSASDVLQLAAEVQQRVLDHSGIALEREVVVWSKRGEVR